MMARRQATLAQRGRVISLPLHCLQRETCNRYCNDFLLAKGYLQAGDFLKLLNASGTSLTATITPGTPDTIAFTNGVASLKVYPVSDAAPSNAIFAVSHNYDYDTALGPAASSQIPYGTNGFIVVQKGGSAAVFKQGQALDTGWGADPTVFQTQVGIKCIEDGTCDPTGGPVARRSRQHVDVSLRRAAGSFSLV